MLCGFRQNRRTVFLQADTGHTCRTHIADKQVNHCQTRSRQHTGNRRGLQQIRAVVHAHGANGIDDDNGKHQRSQRVHGAVAFQNTFNQRMSGKIALCSLWHTHRVNSGIADQYCNCQQQNGCKDFTDTVNQFTRRNRQPISHAEKHQAEYGQCDVFPRFINERRDGGFKRYRCRTRHGKQGADCQIKRSGKSHAVPGRNTGSQRFHIARAGITDGNHAQQWQPRTGQQKAEHCRKPVFAGLLPQISRVN